MTIAGCLPCQHDKSSWQQGCSALCHLHGQVGVISLSLSLFQNLSSLYAAKGLPLVPMAIQCQLPMRGSLCSQTTTTTTSWAASYLKWNQLSTKKILNLPNNLLLNSVQLLLDARLSDQLVPTKASLWLAASWQTVLEVHICVSH